MKYTPEQHLETARQREREAKEATDPKKRETSKISAQKHRLAARAGRAVQAKKLTEEAIDRARQETHKTRPIASLTYVDDPFDEETYKNALPFFTAGLEHFKGSVTDVAGTVKYLVRHLAQNGMDRDTIELMRLYLRRFIEDEQARADNATTDEHIATPDRDNQQVAKGSTHPRENITSELTTFPTQPEKTSIRIISKKVPQTEESLFLSKLEEKFRTLLEESLDPQSEIQNAARRMEAEDMLWQRPWPNSSPRQAAFQVFGDNEALTEWWMDIRDRGWWESALTPEELITAILPKYDTLD